MTDLDLGWFVVSLNVADIEQSLAFYQALGFQIANGSVESRVVTITKGNCRLALYQGFLDPRSRSSSSGKATSTRSRKNSPAKGCTSNRAKPKAPARERC